MLYPCMFCVALLMDAFVVCAACFTVFVNCMVKLFAISLGVVVILLLNVIHFFKIHNGLCHDGVTRMLHFVRLKNLPYST